jgi:hypothetical protein
VSGPPRDFTGFRLTSEARAVVAGILVAAMFLMFAAIRLDPSGGGAHPLTAVSARTIPALWVVHSGETFGSIAARTGLSVAALEALNPYTYPGSLQVGQAIKLRP